MKRTVGRVFLVVGLLVFGLGSFLGIRSASSFGDLVGNVWLPVVLGVTLLLLGFKLAENKHAYCASCGQYLGRTYAMRVPCVKCGSNRYTHDGSGVGETVRVR